MSAGKLFLLIVVAIVVAVAIINGFAASSGDDYIGGPDRPDTYRIDLYEYPSR